MKNVTCVVLFLSILISVFSRTGFANDEKIFTPEIEKAVDAAIEAWTKQDAIALQAALKRLTLNEAYLMAVSPPGNNRSYLARTPRALNRDFNGVAAYLFLLRRESQGTILWPSSFFEGNRFELEQRGAWK